MVCRRCYHGLEALLPRVGAVVLKVGIPRFSQRRAVLLLQGDAGNATECRRRCYRRQSTVLLAADGVAANLGRCRCKGFCRCYRRQSILLSAAGGVAANLERCCCNGFRRCYRRCCDRRRYQERRDDWSFSFLCVDGEPSNREEACGDGGFFIFSFSYG